MHDRAHDNLRPQTPGQPIKQAPSDRRCFESLVPERQGACGVMTSAVALAARHKVSTPHPASNPATYAQGASSAIAPNGQPQRRCRQTTDSACISLSARVKTRSSRVAPDRRQKVSRPRRAHVLCEAAITSSCVTPCARFSRTINSGAGTHGLSISPACPSACSSRITG